MSKVKEFLGKRLLKGRDVTEYIDWLAILIVLAFLYLCFINHDNYEKAVVYASLGAFVSLALIFFNHVSWIEALKNREKELILMLLADAVTLINLLIVNSGLGAFLTVADVLLILYLADKAVFTRAQFRTITGTGVFFFLLWTLEIKWDYGSNQTGLVILTMTILTVMYLEFLKDQYKLRVMWAAQAAAMAFSYIWIVWLRARCAWAGLLVFAALFFLPRALFKVKWFYKLMMFGSTAGAILFAGLYVMLSGLGVDFYMPFMYKKFLSGRELIWFELIASYLRKSLTGLGSSYKMKVYYMDGLLEVHNGLLDILLLHGTIVFGFVLYFLWRRLRGIRETAAHDAVAKTAMAGIFAILIASFFENYFINAPYSMIFFFLFLIINGRREPKGRTQNTLIKRMDRRPEGHRQKSCAEGENLV